MGGDSLVPTLKARIGGAWVDVGGAGVSEVAIGPTDPGDSTTELWYDTDEPNLFDPDTARWNSAWGTVAYAQVHVQSDWDRDVRY